MARIAKDTVRKLVTLPRDVAVRVEEFQKLIQAPSESDALRMLIEDGLKTRDRPDDLFAHLQAATDRGQGVADLIGFLAHGHPLVASTYLDSAELIVNLKKLGPQVLDVRFVYLRAEGDWGWEEGTQSDSGSWQLKRYSPAEDVKE